MKFHSTNKHDKNISLKQAVLSGLAQDGGLFLPDEIPTLLPNFINQLPQFSFEEICLEVARAFLGQDIDTKSLEGIVKRSMTFDAPLKTLDDSLHFLELFHGPTLAFKDFGARFMAELMGFLVREEARQLTILVATSGDTGGAVAAGFYKTPGIRVVILYPSGKVSPLQEKQLTTLGENISALEVQGTFDDCQRLVKQAFVDGELTQRLFLSSANSINIARLIPQSFYYFRAFAQLIARYGIDFAKKTVFCVPSGNFGNLCAGLIAKRMGLPIARFIAASNANATIPEYLQSGVFSPRPSKATISNAMDVGNPSNFARMQELYASGIESLRRDLDSYSFNDEQTRQSMLEVFSKYNYILDPHSAVGYLGVKQFWQDQARQARAKAPAVILATAHPAKFVEVVEDTIKQNLQLPDALKRCLEKEKKSTLIPAEYSALKDYLSR